MRPFPVVPRGGALFGATLFVVAWRSAVARRQVPEGAQEPPAVQPTAPPLPANAEPPAPAVNLSGFPLPYRQGYADGCASATGPERKDAVRFGADGNYRTGWTDGLALCRKK